MSVEPKGNSAAGILAVLAFVLVLGSGSFFATRWLGDRIIKANTVAPVVTEPVRPPQLPCVVLLLSGAAEMIRVPGVAYLDKESHTLYLFKSEQALQDYLLDGSVRGEGAMAIAPGGWSSFWMFPADYCKPQPPAETSSRYSDQRGKPSTI